MKQANEWTVQTSKQTNKQVAQYSGPIHWLIWTTVLRFVDAFPRPPPLELPVNIQAKIVSFKDALSHLYKRVCPSVFPLVPWSHMSSISEKSNISTLMEQNTTKNMKLYHLKGNWETSARADCKNKSAVWTPSDLLLGLRKQILQDELFSERVGTSKC